MDVTCTAPTTRRKSGRWRRRWLVYGPNYHAIHGIVRTRAKHHTNHTASRSHYSCRQLTRRQISIALMAFLAPQKGCKSYNKGLQRERKVQTSKNYSASSVQLSSSQTVKSISWYQVRQLVRRKVRQLIRRTVRQLVRRKASYQKLKWITVSIFAPRYGRSRIFETQHFTAHGAPHLASYPKPQSMHAAQCSSLRTTTPTCTIGVQNT